MLRTSKKWVNGQKITDNLRAAKCFPRRYEIRLSDKNDMHHALELGFVTINDVPAPLVLNDSFPFPPRSSLNHTHVHAYTLCPAFIPFFVHSLTRRPCSPIQSLSVSFFFFFLYIYTYISPFLRGIQHFIDSSHLEIVIILSQ
jgi:hypothetical protein